MSKEEKTYTFSFKKKEIIGILIGLFVTYVIVFMLGVELGKEFFISSIPVENIQQNQYPPVSNVAPSQPPQSNLTAQAPANVQPNATTVPVMPAQVQTVQNQNNTVSQPQTVGVSNTTSNTAEQQETLRKEEAKKTIAKTEEKTQEEKQKVTEKQKTQEAKKLEAKKESKTTKGKEEVDIERIKKEVTTTHTAPPQVAKVVKPQEVSNKYKTGITPPPKRYFVQVGAFTDNKNALDLANRLRSKGLAATVQKAGNLYKVVIGPYNNEEEARKILPTIRKEELYGYIVSY